MRPSRATSTCYRRGFNKSPEAHLALAQRLFFLTEQFIILTELFFSSGEFLKSGIDLLVLPEQFMFCILEIGDITTD